MGFIRNIFRFLIRHWKFTAPITGALIGVFIYLFFFLFAFHLLWIDDKVNETEINTEAGEVLLFDENGLLITTPTTQPAAAATSPNPVSAAVEQPPTENTSQSDGNVSEEGVSGESENPTPPPAEEEPPPASTTAPVLGFLPNLSGSDEKSDQSGESSESSESDVLPDLSGSNTGNTPNTPSGNAPEQNPLPPVITAPAPQTTAAPPPPSTTAAPPPPPPTTAAPPPPTTQQAGPKQSPLSSFYSISHGTSSGTASVVVSGNQSFLSIFNLDTSNGPDLNVYLVASKRSDCSGSGTCWINQGFVDLGDLKGNVGNSQYEIPPGTDLSIYSTALVWCVRFDAAFTASELNPVP